MRESRITPLSDRRARIEHGGRVHYIRQITAPKPAGEGWDEWNQTGPPGSEPEDGVFEVDSGDETVRVRARDFAGAFVASTESPPRPTP